MYVTVPNPNSQYVLYLVDEHGNSGEVLFTADKTGPFQVCVYNPSNTYALTADVAVVC